MVSPKKPSLPVDASSAASRAASASPAAATGVAAGADFWAEAAALGLESPAEFEWAAEAELERYVAGSPHLHRVPLRLSVHDAWQHPLKLGAGAVCALMTPYPPGTLCAASRPP